MMNNNHSRSFDMLNGLQFNNSHVSHTINDSRRKQLKPIITNVDKFNNFISNNSNQRESTRSK